MGVRIDLDAKGGEECLFRSSFLAPCLEILPARYSAVIGRLWIASIEHFTRGDCHSQEQALMMRHFALSHFLFLIFNFFKSHC